MKVDGKVIVVTGAGNGVGRAVALEALRRGAQGRGRRRQRGGARGDGQPGRGRRAALDPRRRHHRQGGRRGAPAEVERPVRRGRRARPLAAIIQPFVRVKDLDDAAIERVFASTGGARST